MTSPSLPSEFAWVADVAIPLSLDLVPRGDQVDLEAEKLITSACIARGNDAGSILFFRFRTTSWQFPGERTDLHDVMPHLVCLALAAEGHSGLGLVDIDHPVMPGELYGRLMVSRQPRGPLVDSSRVKEVTDLVAHVLNAEQMVWHVVASQNRDFDGPAGPADEAWTDIVRRALRRKPESIQDAQRRDNPPWRHYRVPRTRLSIVDSPRVAAFVHHCAEATSVRASAVTGLFVVSGRLKLFARSCDIDRATRLLKRIEGPCRDGDDIALALTEDRVVAAGRTHTVFVPADCSRVHFEIARSVEIQRTREALALLAPNRSWRWADPVPDDRFEELIAELLEASGDVWVRQSGPTRDRDRGRDLIAEWAVPLDRVVGEDPPTRLHRVVVQCKARAGTVGRSHVTNIRDSVEDHGADGFFLAVSTQISSPLADTLSALRARSGWFVEWWTRTEIERELRRSPWVADRFTDVVTAATT